MHRLSQAWLQRQTGPGLDVETARLSHAAVTQLIFKCSLGKMWPLDWDWDKVRGHRLSHEEEQTSFRPRLELISS